MRLGHGMATSSITEHTLVKAGKGTEVLGHLKEAVQEVKVNVVVAS